MIWQLVKRDPAWQTALVITSVTVLDVARRNDPSTVTSVIGIFILLLMLGRIYERTDLFSAALPVSARQILLARLVAILSLWIPIGVTAAIVWALQRPSGVALSLVEVGIDVTALSILILCARPRQFRAPLPWVAAVIAVAHPVLDHHNGASVGLRRRAHSSGHSRGCSIPLHMEDPPAIVSDSSRATGRPPVGGSSVFRRRTECGGYRSAYPCFRFPCCCRCSPSLNRRVGQWFSSAGSQDSLLLEDLSRYSDRSDGCVRYPSIRDRR